MPAMGTHRAAGLAAAGRGASHVWAFGLVLQMVSVCSSCGLVLVYAFKL